MAAEIIDTPAMLTALYRPAAMASRERTTSVTAMSQPPGRGV